MQDESAQRVAEDQADGEVESSPKDLLEETLERIIRCSFLQTLVPAGQTPSDVTVTRAAELLLPYEDAIQAYLAMAREVGEQYFLMGCGSVHETLHAAEGVDNEMLDEAVEFHSSPRDMGPAVELE